MNTIKIYFYATPRGKEPFSEWYDDLDKQARLIIRNRLDRIEIGNFGDAKVIKGGEGIWELRIDHGPGYRLYFGKQGSMIIILLTGGDKKSQSKDIERAIKYWIEWKDKK